MAAESIRAVQPGGPHELRTQKGFLWPGLAATAVLVQAPSPEFFLAKQGVVTRPSALGTRMWWSLSPAQLRAGGFMWLLVLAAADVPGGCFFFLAVFGCFVDAMGNERGVLIVSAHLQGSCVSGCFVSASFGGLRPQ